MAQCQRAGTAGQSGHDPATRPEAPFGLPSQSRQPLQQRPPPTGGLRRAVVPQMVGRDRAQKVANNLQAVHTKWSPARRGMAKYFESGAKRGGRVEPGKKGDGQAQNKSIFLKKNCLPFQHTSNWKVLLSLGQGLPPLLHLQASARAFGSGF